MLLETYTNPMLTNGEPWVALRNEASFKNYEKKELISHNQQMRQALKFQFYQLVFDFLDENRIFGDYHEFGCHRCRTFRMVLTEARRRCSDWMNFYAYDSFEGLPSITSDPDQESWKEGALMTSEDEFCSLIEKHGIYKDRVKRIVGFYSESLKSKVNWDRKASLITVDCDLFESAKYVFDYLPPLIQDGTVLYIDDYFTGYKGDSRKGVAKAFNESGLLDQYHVSSFLSVGWWGKSFLLHQK